MHFFTFYLIRQKLIRVIRLIRDMAKSMWTPDRGSSQTVATNLVAHVCLGHLCSLVLCLQIYYTTSELCSYRSFINTF